jgi:ABC-type transport system involved in multi-copper enzyme maturation permease subunit
MWKKICSVSTNEFKTLFKEKTFIILLIIFILMTVFSTYIGWSTKNTIEKVYEETVIKLKASGVTEIPLNTFSSIPLLSILKNMIVYIFLIGSLLAIIIGHSSFMRDRKAGISKIVFSRTISRKEFITGKIIGIFGVLTLIIMVSFVISYASTILVTGNPLTGNETMKLLIFYVVSLVYLLIFALIGLFFAIYSRSESLALLTPIIIWIVISFVLPQLTSALNPNALLNPISIQGNLPHSKFFIIMQEIIKPFSLSESYKELGSNLLGVGSINTSVMSILSNSTAGIFLMLSSLSVLIYGSIFSIKKFDVCEEEINE